MSKKRGTIHLWLWAIVWPGIVLGPWYAVDIVKALGIWSIAGILCFAGFAFGLSAYRNINKDAP